MPKLRGSTESPPTTRRNRGGARARTAYVVCNFTCARRIRCETVAFTGRRGGTGRRAGLKIQYSQECVGSTPSAGTTQRYACKMLRRQHDCLAALKQPLGGELSS